MVKTECFPSKKIPLRSGTRHGYMPLLLLFNIVLEVLAGQLGMKKKEKAFRLERKK